MELVHRRKALFSRTVRHRSIFNISQDVIDLYVMERHPFGMLLFFLSVLLLGLVHAQPSDPGPDSENPPLLAINIVMDDEDQVLADPHTWYYHPAVPEDSNDLRGRLLCIGKPPAFAIPAPYAQNSYTSLLDMCAKASYGGLPMANVGGYCGWFLPYPLPVFDLATAAPLWHSPGYRNARRIVNYCMTKCSCALDLIPEAHLDFKIINYVQPQYMWQSDFDSITEQAIPYAPPSSVRRMTVLLFLEEQKVSNLFLEIKQVALTGSSANYLECLQTRPPQHYLPSSVRGLPYPDLVSLCSASLLGGSVKGSVGGACVMRSHDWSHRDIAFPNEYAYPPFEIRYDTEPYSVVTMLWCQQHCWCKNPMKRRFERPSKTVPWLFDATVNFRNGGCTWTPDPRIIDTVSESEYVLIPGRSHGQRGGSESQTCAAGAADPESEKCTNSWPADLPLPAQPSIPDFTGKQIILPLPEATPLVAAQYDLTSIPEPAICGTTCSGNRACLQQGGPGCRCVVNPSLAIVKAAGLDPEVPGARCLSWALLGGSLLGRSLEGTERKMEDYGLLCACNHTYISSGCCGSAEGLVWESGGSMGRLRIGIPDDDEYRVENDSQNPNYF